MQYSRSLNKFKVLYQQKREGNTVINKSLRVSAVAVKSLSIMLVLSLFFVSLPTFALEKYVYYGVVPGRFRYAQPRKQLHGAIDPSAGWDLVFEADFGYLSIIASEDNTKVEIFSLTDSRLESAVSLNAMEKHFIRLPNGTAFKVTSNHLISVMLTSSPIGFDATQGFVPIGFYTSTNGSYVGKEFVFVASQGLAGTPYRILALEDSDITIYKEDGSIFTSFTLKPNEYKDFAFSTSRGYRVISSGNVMIQSFHSFGGEELSFFVHNSFFVPSAKGGFMGTIFYSDSKTNWDTIEPCGFRISALEDTKVAIWGVELNRIIQEFEVKGGSGVIVKPKADEMLLESNKPVTLSFVHYGGIRRSYGWSYGTGVTYMGVKANEETVFYLPEESSVEAYVFAYDDAVVRIDTRSPQPIENDSYLLLTKPGTHRIISDKDIVVQVMHWPLTPSIQGIAGYAVIVPCIQGINASPDVTLTPLSEGFPLTCIIIGIGVTVATVVMAFIIMFTRRS